ncbi:MAG: hypothetical protein JSS14_11685 [Proteobacteria bacterium]|nr:hypothetical protein [Pseudomonadota bacterium]
MQGRRIETLEGVRRRLFPWCLSWLLLCAAGHAAWAQQPSPLAQTLLARHASIQAHLEASPLGRPLMVDSEELPGGLRGEVFAVVDQPFAQAAKVLAKPGNWCDMLLLHINNRRCRLIKGEGGSPPAVELSVVRRYDQPVESAFILRMNMNMDDSAPDYVVVDLRSEGGPMGTSGHHVRLEATPLPDGGKTFLHFSYSYQHNTLARMATQAYLATFGHNKVGFTVEGQGPQGPEYIRGLRGLVERNSVRYFLTVDAYLDALRAPPAQQQERRLDNWYAACEQYPRQLHEVDQATYLAIKRADRSRAGPAAP